MCEYVCCILGFVYYDSFIIEVAMWTSLPFYLYAPVPTDHPTWLSMLRSGKFQCPEKRQFCMQDRLNVRETRGKKECLVTSQIIQERENECFFPGVCEVFSYGSLSQLVPFKF